MPKRDTPENKIKRACLDYLHGVRHIPCWRNNTGSVVASYNGRTRFIQFSVKGASDIFGILKPRGVFLAVECKVKPKKPTVEQAAFLDMVRDAGGVAVVAYTLDDLHDAIEGFYASR